jgi:hypothetical protein
LLVIFLDIQMDETANPRFVMHLYRIQSLIVFYT